MRKIIGLTTLAGTVMLGGCASLGGLLGDPYGNDGYGYGSGYGYGGQGQFEQVAVNACGRQAERYGRVSIDNVYRDGNDYMKVEGRTDNRSRDYNEFKCTVRSDGAIVEFRMY